MDVLRRAATGRLAELLGPSYLLMDEVVRRDGFTAGGARATSSRVSPRATGARSKRTATA